MIYSKKSGIYAIRCNTKYYIGATRNINKRIKEHIRKLEQGCHQNKLLQKDYDNGNKFEYLDLKHCSVDELNKNELYYINKYNSIENGYNIIYQGHSDKVGISRYGKENPMYNKSHSQKARDKISKAKSENTGWKHSEKTKDKMSQSAKDRWSKTPKKPYRARIRIKGIDVSLGNFETKEERDNAILNYKKQTGLL